jgi:hypothetical protein
VPAMTVDVDESEEGDEIGRDSDAQGDQRRQRVEALVLTVLAAAPVLATVVRAVGTWRPVGDNAIIALRSSDVFTGHSPLLGMPTTLSRSAGQVLHHPGPIEFWVIALGQVVSGHRLVPMLAVVTVNLLAIGAIVVMGGWLGGRNGRLIAALTILVCTWSLRGDFLIEPYNPYAAWMPLGAFAVGLVCVMAGRWWALPVAVVFGTYAAQSHVSLVVPVAACVVAAIAAGTATAVQHHGGVGPAWRAAVAGCNAVRKPLVTAGALAIATWAPVLVDMVIGQRNLFGLAGSTGSGPVVGLRSAWHATARGITSPPWLDAERDGFETLSSAGGLRQLAALVVLAAGAGLVVVLWSRRHPSLWMLVVAGAGLVGGTTAVSRIPGGTLAPFTAYNYLWLWVFTALLWVGIVVGGIVAARSWARTATAIDRRTAEVGQRVAVGMLVLVAVVATVTEPVRASVLGGRHAPSVAALAEQLPASLDTPERLLIFINDDLDQSSVAMALVRELEILGFSALVSPAFSDSFGDHRVADGAVDATLVVVSERARTPEPPDDTAELIATFVPDPAVSIELAQANAAIEARIIAEGGATVGVDRVRLDADDAIALVRSGDLIWLHHLQLVVAPELPAAEFRRYARAHEGPILQVHVYRMEGSGPP